MNFTPKATVGPVASGMLAIAVGLIGSAGHVVSASERSVATQVAFSQQESVPTDEHLGIVPVMAQVQAPGPQTARPATQRKTAWYKNKHWWKKNAPIVGGVGGGALIGGLAGGGKGVIIGGAAGAGGGYLYKHLKHSHHHDHQ